MSFFVCPKCGSNLVFYEHVCKCESGHSYDIAKSGYINLFMNQQIHDKRHGDDKFMLRARRDFLNKGYYNDLIDFICKSVMKLIKDNDNILDVGCGEGKYTNSIYDILKKNGNCFDLCGIDISKDAVMMAASDNKNISYAVASAYNLPVKEKTCNIILNIFAPHCQEEFNRALSDDGFLIRVFPGKKHLIQLKSIIYDTPYENSESCIELEGFEHISFDRLHYKININNNQDIQNLFSMTPYYYKSSEKDQKKIDTINNLETEVEFIIAVYRKK